MKNFGDITQAGTHTFQKPVVLGPFTIATLPVVVDGSVAAVTDDPESPLYVRVSGVWKQASGVDSSLVTTGALSFVVDHDLVGAALVTPGTVFTQQSEITAALTAAGTTAFKYLGDCYDALPPWVRHTATFTLAAGVHRPRATDTSTGWALNTKVLDPITGKIVVQGALPSLYNPVHASLVGLSITAFQAGSNDPYLDFAGTPFTGFNLKGSMAVLSTGQTVMIHDHTASRLFLTQNLSPSPAGGTCTAAKPSTILRNSAVDVTSLAFSALDINSRQGAPPGFTGNRFEINDVLVDAFGAGGNHFAVTSVSAQATRCILDQLSMIVAFSRTPNGNGFFANSGAILLLNNCSHINTTPAGGGADLLASVSDGGLSFQFCYMQGSEDGVQCNGTMGKSTLTLFCTVFEAVGVNAVALGGIWLAKGMMLDLFDPGAVGKRNEIRGQAVGVPGIFFQSDSRVVRPEFHGCSFKSNAAPCIKLGDRAYFDISGSTNGMLDGGGNTDVGIQVDGPQALVKLNTGTTVTGTIGNTKIDDVVVPYTSLGTNAAPTVTTKLNVVGRG